MYKFFEKFFNEPKVEIGAVWYWNHSYVEHNPFRPELAIPKLVQILDIKDGWVQYRWGDESVGESPIASFRGEFSLWTGTGNT